MPRRRQVGDRVEVKVVGGNEQGWLAGEIVQIKPIKVKLDCDGYIVSGGDPRKHIRKEKTDERRSVQ